MGPKKGKEVVDDENYWRVCIEDAILDDESWKVKTILIEAAGSDQDRIYLDKFETCAAEERRFVIKNICKTETIFMVNQLGGEKKVKDDNLRVFEEGQAYLKEKKGIPPEILALIIKHLILKMKVEYLFIKQQRLEVKEGMNRESKTMINKAEVRGTINVKPPEPVEPPPPLPKGKKDVPENIQKPFDVDENKKYSTLLRVRGEEWRDKVYIDDYPKDGPNLYVAITGFVEPNLAGCLVKIGVPLTAVVQIRIDPTTTTIPSSLFRSTKRGQSQTEMIAEKSFKFWEDLQFLRINKDSADDFINTAFIVFSPPYWNNDNLSGAPDKIYDEICYLMYDIQDLSRQHKHYIENMDIIAIPDQHKDDRFLSYYEKRIDGIPYESISPYLVLDSILQAVCESQKINNKSNTSSLSTAMTLNQTISDEKEHKLNQSKTLAKNLIDELCKIESRKKEYRLTYGDEYENHKNPIVINYADFCKYKTFHLGNLNLDNIVWTMLLGMPINKLWLNKNRPTGDIEAKLNFHVNVLLSCFDRTDVETAELCRLIHILASRKIYNNRSSLKKEHLFPSTISEFKKVYLKRSVLAQPFPKSFTYKSASSTSPSFPSMIKSSEESDKSLNDSDDQACRIKFLFDCPDISELVSANEIMNEKPINHMIDDFEYFEDFKGIEAFQIILDAFNNYNCVDYKYCEVTDCFILMFFNSHDKDGISREEWRCHLPTPLCLQDFFDFVLEEHYDWIKNEEKLYDENILQRSQSERKDSRNILASKACVDDCEVELDMLMEGSLKYEERVNLEAVSPETTDTKSFSSKKLSSPLSVADIDSKSSRKTKSPTNTAKTRNFENVDAKEEPKKKHFSGYDLGERRVEAFGKDSSYYSKDGTRVSSFYSLLIPMNLENVILNIVPGSGDIEFWLHKALGEIINPNLIDTCESFRIKSKDQVVFYIKKQIYQVPIPVANTSSGNVRYKENTVKPPSPERSNMSPLVFDSRSYHSLFVTWPNGHITESIYENNLPEISHIKQYYLTPLLHLDEEMRCISLKGEVIVFKCNGDIEIFLPNATCIKINKYGKKAISDEILEDVTSAASSDKSKKGKEKGKGKDKPSKTFSKSSKNTLTEDEKDVISPPIEYRLVIEEFEIIETNGLRQKFINDNYIDIEKLLTKTATDFCLGEVYSRRMDGTSILLNKDGIHHVTFPNKTSIYTKFIIEDEEIYPEWTEEEMEYLSLFTNEIDATLKSRSSMSHKSFVAPDTNSNSETSLGSEKQEMEHVNHENQKTDGYVSIQIIYTIEHPNFTTVTIDKSNGKISIESPNNTRVSFDENNHYDFFLDNRTSATFNGENLNINYEACCECKSCTTCEVKIKTEEISSVTQIQRNWLKLKDSFCNRISVNEEGNINLVDDNCNAIPSSKESINSEELLNSSDSNKNKMESCTTVHGKCTQLYEAKAIKFFVLRRDLTCSELINRNEIEHYKQACRWQPWCFINNYDTFGDHRTLWSILTPVHLNESEKWLMDSKLSNKPKYLKYKDLKKDSGKGFYHWMRPYERFQPKPIKPDNVLPERLPRAYILRTLEQQWKESEREELKGAKELLRAILRYRQVMESDSETLLHIPIQDPRTEDERRTDEVVQAIAHRVYEDLRVRLEEDVQSRAKADITTKPPPVPEEMSMEGEFDEEARDDYRAIEEERASLVKEVEMAAEPSPSFKRYWRRRAEEFKEEQFYRYLLREGSVPPYFRNVLGGAIWWEIDKAADDAVTKAERRKMKCVCDEDEQASGQD